MIVAQFWFFIKTSRTSFHITFCDFLTFYSINWPVIEADKINFFRRCESDFKMKFLFSKQCFVVFFSANISFVLIHEIIFLLILLTLLTQNYFSRYCFAAPPSIVTDGNELLVSFTSNFLGRLRGFKAMFSHSSTEGKPLAFWYKISYNIIKIDTHIRHFSKHFSTTGKRNITKCQKCIFRQSRDSTFKNISFTFYPEDTSWRQWTKKTVKKWIFGGNGCRQICLDKSLTTSLFWRGYIKKQNLTAVTVLLEKPAVNLIHVTGPFLYSHENIWKP